MLTIKTHLAPSTIHGVGVFATENVIKGDVIWTYNAQIDFFVPVAGYEVLPQFIQDYLDCYVYFDRDLCDHSYIYCSDHAKYINHHRTPNTSTKGSSYVALRDIAAGEELTCDYREFSWARPEDMPHYL